MFGKLGEIEKGLDNLNELQKFIDQLGGLPEFKAMINRLKEFDDAIIEAGGVKAFIKQLQGRR